MRMTWFLTCALNAQVKLDLAKKHFSAKCIPGGNTVPATPVSAEQSIDKQ